MWALATRVEEGFSYNSVLAGLPSHVVTPHQPPPRRRLSCFSRIATQRHFCNSGSFQSGATALRTAADSLALIFIQTLFKLGPFAAHYITYKWRRSLFSVWENIAAAALGARGEHVTSPLYCLLVPELSNIGKFLTSTTTLWLPINWDIFQKLVLEKWKFKSLCNSTL